MIKQDGQKKNEIMTSIKSKDTKPELLLRKELWYKGIGE